jgi:hypothetical protein
LHSDTYMGVELIPELAPNIAFHFSIHGGWPTVEANPFLYFAKPEAASMIAQRCEQIPIEVHVDREAPEAHVKLITASEASARRHRQKTPRTSKAPAESLAPKNPPNPPPAPAFASPSRAPASQLGTKTNPAIPEPRTPSGTNLFRSNVYSPPQGARQSSSKSSLGRSSTLSILYVQPKWGECMTWDINSAATREHCSQEYLAICQLLAHGPAVLDLNKPAYRVRRTFTDPWDKQILARAPCQLGRTRILIPVYAPNSVGPIVDNVRLYFQGNRLSLDRAASLESSIN